MKGDQRFGRPAQFGPRSHVGTHESANCERGSRASTMRSSLLAVQRFVKKSRMGRVLSSRANGTPFDGPPLMERDVEFMQIALEEARSAAAAGEVPVGAVLVRDSDGVVAARGANRTI